MSSAGNFWCPFWSKDPHMAFSDLDPLLGGGRAVAPLTPASHTSLGKPPKPGGLSHLLCALCVALVVASGWEVCLPPGSWARPKMKRNQWAGARAQFGGKLVSHNTQP